jgi:hypothetical protein
LLSQGYEGREVLRGIAGQTSWLAFDKWAQLRVWQSGSSHPDLRVLRCATRNSRRDKPLDRFYRKLFPESKIFPAAQTLRRRAALLFMSSLALE